MTTPNKPRKSPAEIEMDSCKEEILAIISKATIAQAEKKRLKDAISARLSKQAKVILHPANYEIGKLSLRKVLQFFGIEKMESPLELDEANIAHFRPIPLPKSLQRSLKEIDTINLSRVGDNEQKSKTRFDRIFMNCLYKVKAGDHDQVEDDADYNDDTGHEDDEDDDDEDMVDPPLGPFGLSRLAIIEEIEPDYEVQLEWEVHYDGRIVKVRGRADYAIRYEQEATDPMALNLVVVEAKRAVKKQVKKIPVYMVLQQMVGSTTA
ncbi:hypothetical protein BJX64DRAFT_293277 [Aspergillus heterothallicus]